MAGLHLLVLSVWLACGVIGQPLDITVKPGVSRDAAPRPRLWRRFVNPELTSGSFADEGLLGLRRMRTRRSPEGCEKLQLCKLHARSNRNFLSAFELYFVNKENAKLWDHNNGRSIADCERRFAGVCYGNAEAAPRQEQYRFVDDDDYE